MASSQRADVCYPRRFVTTTQFPAIAAVSGASRLQTVFGLLVLILFIGVAATWSANYLKLHGTEHAVESARTLDTLLAQYATDNNGVYPVGEGTRAEGKSEGIALDLLLNNYTPNADLFSVGSTPRYTGTAKDYADLAPENMSWDFTAGANATTGMKADAPDMLPVLYTTGETVDYGKTGGLEPSGKGPFGRKGIVVADKGGDAFYLPAQPDENKMPRAFIGGVLNGTDTYTQIRP
jgi:hypothetical protein